jgi:hypothetical protein
MKVSGQLHARAALPPGKEPPVLIGEEAGSGHCKVEENLSPLPGIEARRYTD